MGTIFFICVVAIGIIYWMNNRTLSSSDYTINYTPPITAPRSPTQINVKFEKSLTSIPSHVFFDVETKDFVDPEINNPSALDYITLISSIAWMVTDNKGGEIVSKHHLCATDKELKPVLGEFMEDAKDVKFLVGNNLDYILLSLTNSVERCLGKNLDHLEKVCTMQMGKPYCKIYRYDSDEYKWPKFTELIEHCLNGGNAVYIPNLGKAEVDMKLMAKCYWRMKGR